jgi:predicted transcriptional regulator
MTVRLEPEVRDRVHAAARAAGGDASAWVCHHLHQATLADLPAQWQTGEAALRSHDSRYYGKRYMMRLDDATWDKLEALSKRFGKSIAEVIRELVAHAEVEDFPPSWQKVVDPRQTPSRPHPSRRRTTP